MRGGDQAGVIGFGHRAALALAPAVDADPVEQAAPRAGLAGTPVPPPRPARSPCRTRGPPGSARGAPRSAPSAGAGSARPRPRSTHTPRSPPLASYLRPGHRPPRRDRVLIALRRPVHRHLRAEPQPVQQERRPAQRVQRTWNSRPISAATRSSVHRWSSAQPHTAGPASSAARSRPSCAAVQPARRPARAPGGQGGLRRRPASAAATRTPNYTRPAAAAPPPAAQPPPRTTPRPATAPSHAWPAQRRTGHHHPDTSYLSNSPASSSCHHRTIQEQSPTVIMLTIQSL